MAAGRRRRRAWTPGCRCYSAATRMPPWRTAQMVLPAQQGTVPMIRPQGRSLDVIGAGTCASRLARSISQAAETGRGRQRGPHRQRCGPFHEPCSGEDPRCRYCQRQLDRQERHRRSNPWQTAPCSVDYNQDAFLRKYILALPRYMRAAFEQGCAMTEPIDKDIATTSRRRFLRDGGALVGGAVIAGGLGGSQALAATANADNLPPNVPEWMKTHGDPMGSQPYGTPSPFEKDVVKNIPKNLPQYLSASGRTPLQDLDGIITPNGLFYERHHAGVPTIDPAQHRLMLHGLVDKPLIFTMDDIRRFPSQSRIYFLECSGNPGYKKPYGKTASDLVGLVGCAEWTGVSLKLVLQEAGLQAGAT